VVASAARMSRTTEAATAPQLRTTHGTVRKYWRVLDTSSRGHAPRCLHTTMASKHTMDVESRPGLQPTTTNYRHCHSACPATDGPAVPLSTTCGTDIENGIRDVKIHVWNASSSFLLPRAHDPSPH
jgi:hypothetical protein